MLLDILTKNITIKLMIKTKIDNLTEMLKKLSAQKNAELRVGNIISANALESVQMDIEAKILELSAKTEKGLVVKA